MPAVAGYSHVAICVSDAERSKEFYGQTLGLPEIPRPGMDFPGGWFVIGDLQLHLMQREMTGGEVRGIGPHFALYIPTEDFHDEVERLRGAGVAITREPEQRDGDGIWAAFCADPDGNTIEPTDMGPDYLDR